MHLLFIYSVTILMVTITNYQIYIHVLTVTSLETHPTLIFIFHSIGLTITTSLEAQLKFYPAYAVGLT